MGCNVFQLNLVATQKPQKVMINYRLTVGTLRMHFNIELVSVKNLPIVLRNKRKLPEKELSSLLFSSQWHFNGIVNE